MTRVGTEAYDSERTFLEETMALVHRQLARRAEKVARDLPELAEAVRTAVTTPAAQWREPVDREIEMEFYGLKLEQALIEELMRAVEERSLVDALKAKIRSVERQEATLIKEEPGSAYLLDSTYWTDEDTLSVLNRLFTNWARWARGGPLEGP